MNEEGVNTLFNFEQALNELKAIVDEMEEGKLSLEESLQKFERGITITRQCQKTLQEAEQQVQILLSQNDNVTLNEFQHSTDEEN